MYSKRTLKVAIAANSSWNLVNFRSNLIQALVRDGHDVLAVVTADDSVMSLKDLGARVYPMRIAARGTNPLKDIVLFLKFLKLFLRERPNVYLGYTIKPNIYGSLAAHLLNIPTINTISGLGAPFIKKNFVTRVVRFLYKLALSRSGSVLFQNQHDRSLFVRLGLIRSAVACLVPGSGINLTRFTPQPSPANHPFRFLLVARMLWDKGVGEYTEAARLLRRRYPDVEFCLLGYLDVENPTAISRQQMETWVREGVVNYLGTSDRIEDDIAQAHCVVLPSYREGISRTLLEAAAMAKPIVATDVPGCREIVEDGINGYLCAVRDPHDLAAKMSLVLELPAESRRAMGDAGRGKVEAEYDVERVVHTYMQKIVQTAS